MALSTATVSWSALAVRVSGVPAAPATARSRAVRGSGGCRSTPAKEARARSSSPACEERTTTQPSGTSVMAGMARVSRPPRWPRVRTRVTLKPVFPFCAPAGCSKPSPSPTATGWVTLRRRSRPSCPLTRPSTIPRLSGWSRVMYSRPARPPYIPPVKPREKICTSGCTSASVGGTHCPVARRSRKSR